MYASAHIDTFTAQNLPTKALWPELRFDLPELQYPPRINVTTALIDAALARGQGNNTALESPNLSWTYEQLHGIVNQICHVLEQDMGVVAGNRVLLRGANSPMLAACMLAVWKVGAVAVPSMPLLRAKDLATIIDKAHITHALCAAGLREDLQGAQTLTSVLKTVVYFDDTSADGLAAKMQNKPIHFAAVDTAADDVCHIAFTSGTTGVPKGTMHFHRDLLASCDTFAKHVLKLVPTDRVVGTPPLAFTFGLGGLLLFPLRVGAAAVLVEKLSPELLLQAIHTHRATVSVTAPTFYRLMTPLAAQYDLSSLAQCMSAGEALPAATRAAWKAATGIEMLDGIGSTEMFHIFIAAAGADVRAGATGKVVPGYQAEIFDDNHLVVADGVVGKLAIKGPTGCRYLADDRQADYVKQGWNYTGDAYLRDVDGYYWYQARTDDMIVSAGYNIGAPEVENSLLTHAAVTECAVIGVADEARGQIVKAFVVLKTGLLGDASMVKTLQDHVKADIAPYKYPRQIEFMTSLPKTETGKLQRFKLKRS